MHEEVEEDGLVVLVDELEERRDAALGLALIGVKAPRLEAAVGERAQDRLRGELARTQRDVHTAREDRVHEGDGIADGHEAIADDRRVDVGEVRLPMDRADALGVRETRCDRRAAGDHRRVEVVGRARPRPDRPRVHDGAHAGEVVGQRDPPEPAVAHDVDADVALVLARESVGATEVGEERDLAEIRAPAALAEPGGDEAAAPAGVDEHPGSHHRRHPRAAHPHRHAVMIEVGRLDAGGLEDGRTRAARVFQQDGVELGARNFVRVVGPRLSGQEIEGALEALLFVEEHGAVLDLESTCLDLAAHAHLFEQQHGGWHEGLADVKPRKRVALEERHLQTTPAEKRGRRRTARAPTHDDHVVTFVAHRDGSSSALDRSFGGTVTGAAESRA